VPNETADEYMYVCTTGDRVKRPRRPAYRCHSYVWYIPDMLCVPVFVLGLRMCESPRTSGARQIAEQRPTPSTTHISYLLLSLGTGRPTMSMGLARLRLTYLPSRPKDMASRAVLQTAQCQRSAKARIEK